MLYGATTRSLLLYLDWLDVVRVHWSPLLIDEMARALVKTGRTTDEPMRAMTVAMHEVAPGAAVPTLAVQAAFAPAWPGVRDAKDLHVAACAVAIGASAYYPNVRTVHLVTRNQKDFAPKPLARMDVRQQHPDDFLLAVWHSDAESVAQAFRLLREDLPSAPAVEALLDKLLLDGQKRTANAMRSAHRDGEARL